MRFFEFAKRNTRRHWLRSTLAIIGIVIGVVAISTLGILGNSINLMMGDVITDVGDTIIVTPAAESGSNTFSERQIDEITRAVGSNRAIPIATGAARLKMGDHTTGAMIYAMRADDIPYLLEKESGVYLKDTAAACMIGKQLAENNARYGLKLGSRVQLDDDTVRVVGVLEERGMGFDINPDYAIIVPYRWFSDTFDRNDYDQVIVKVRDVDDIDAVMKSIEDRMNRREKTVNVMDTRKVLESIFEMSQSLTVFLMGIGAISLIVAGVSILNVMMMSVTERIKEIGILRSIGTLRREVMRMFLYEALILGLIGSVIGGVLSIVAGFLVTAVMLNDSSYLFNVSSAAYVLFGMAFGIVTSVASGLYPAWNAAQLNPIQALRYE